MQYLGGKHRLAKAISEVILSDTDNREGYIEPLVGAGSVLLRMAPHFQDVCAGDAHRDLIMMYKALQRGWKPPTEVSEELYQSLRLDYPSALRASQGSGVPSGLSGSEAMLVLIRGNLD